MPDRSELKRLAAERADNAQARARVARERAVEALEHAHGRFAAQVEGAEERFRREAELHARAAVLHDQSAKIQREHVEHLDNL